MTTWWQLTLAALFGAALVDLSLFGWTLRALGFGRSFEGPGPGEHLVYDSKVSVHYGRLGMGWAGTVRSS